MRASSRVGVRTHCRLRRHRYISAFFSSWYLPARLSLINCSLQEYPFFFFFFFFFLFNFFSIVRVSGREGLIILVWITWSRGLCNDNERLSIIWSDMILWKRFCNDPFGLVKVSTLTVVNSCFFFNDFTSCKIVRKQRYFFLEDSKNSHSCKNSSHY